MPRNGSGVYSLPPGSTFSPNTLIQSSVVNGINNDIATDLNTARPVVAGGTGSSSIAGAQTNLSVDNKLVYSSKSANYTAIAADNNSTINFTAAATLTLTAAATLAANWHITVMASGGTVIVNTTGADAINGAASISLLKGETAIIICDGAGFAAIIVPNTQWETIGTFTLSNSAGVTITSLSAFRLIKITGAFNGSNAHSLILQVSTNNGSTWDGSNYFAQHITAQGSGVSANGATATGYPLSHPVSPIDIGTYYSIEASIYDFNQAHTASGYSRENGVHSGSRIISDIASMSTITTARNALRFIPTAGTINGFAIVEGVRG